MRNGAIIDMHLIMKYYEEKLENRTVVFVAGDTVFHDDFHFLEYLKTVEESPYRNSILFYEVESEEEVPKRGIVEMEGDRVVRLLEKPPIEQTSSRRASPAFYLFHPTTRPIIDEIVAGFGDLEDRSTLRSRDAPGQLVKYLLEKKEEVDFFGYEIGGRFDVGHLEDYEATCQYFKHKCLEEVHRNQNWSDEGNKNEESLRCERNQSSFVGRTYARAGLIGNPSDGFEGRTISIPVRNFEAVVTLTPNSMIETKEEDSDCQKVDLSISFIPHPIFDRVTSPPSLGSLVCDLNENGYDGGVRLLQATCSSFFLTCLKNGILKPLFYPGFSLKYDTSIPRQVGLAGSSAIILSTFKTLIGYYQISLEEDWNGMTIERVPDWILNVERKELNISAGLQDRVVQAYNHPMFMDFSPSHHVLVFFMILFSFKYQ